jgi:hypothetical protein
MSQASRAAGSRDPLPTAVAWTEIVMPLDLVVVAGAIQRSLALFQSVLGTRLPIALNGLSHGARASCCRVRQAGPSVFR